MVSLKFFRRIAWISLLILVLATPCIYANSLDNTLKTSQLIESSKRGLVLNERTLVIDLGIEVSIESIHKIELLDSSKKLVTDYKINVLNLRNVVVEGNPVDRIKYIKVYNVLYTISLEQTNLKNETNLFAIKEHCLFVDNERLMLKFTQPVDIRTLNNPTLSNKGKVNLAKQYDYYVNDQNMTDYKTVIGQFVDLKPNEVYEMHLSDQITGLKGEKSIINSELSSLKIVRDSFDYTAPTLSSVSTKSMSEIALQFLDASDLSFATVTQVKNYKVLDIATGEAVAINSVSLRYNEQTKKLSELRLKVSGLTLDKRYRVEFDNLADINRNETSGQGFITFFDYEERGAKLVNIEALNATIIRLVFNKEVIIPMDYDISQIVINNNVKPISITKDPIVGNAILLKTTTHDKTVLHRISVEGIEDKYGVVSTKQFGTLNYYPMIGDVRTLNATMLENSNVKGQHALTVSFSEPISNTVEQSLSMFSVNGLELYYLYKVNENQVRIITSRQKANAVYTLSIDEVESVYGSKSSTINKSFAGMSLE